MPNPFEYGGIVEERAFCNRREELDDLRRAAENGDRLLVYAERRMGKTSLVRRMTSRLPPEEYLPIYVDLWATQGAESMAQAVAQAVTEAAATRAEQMLETARALFSRLVPSLTVDPTSGQPRVEFGVEATGSAGKDAAPSLKEALDSPERLAEREAGRRVVVVYDEVQQLAAFDSPQAERLLRSRVQMHQDVAYLFLGSRKHLIRQMFMEKKRPLYQAAGHYPIGPIATEHWRPFIRERFTEGERPIEDAVIDELCERTGGHPYYTQHLAHDLWEVTPRGEPAARGCLHKAEDVLLRRLGHTYTVLWESLTKNQQALLRGLAAEGSEAQPFSAEFLGARGFAASSAHRAAEALLERDVIDKEAGGYLITDRFLSVWLARA